MVNSILKGLGSIIKWSIISTGLVVTGATIFGYNTKPDDKTFKPFFKKWLADTMEKQDKADINNENFLNWIKNKSLSFIVEKSCNIEIKDYMALKVAKVNDTGDILGQSLYFIGFANHWFFVTNEEFYKIKQKFNLL